MTVQPLPSTEARAPSAPALTATDPATALPTEHADLLDPAFQVAPSIALLVAGWGEATADATARDRWIRPLLSLLCDTDGGAAAPDARLLDEARRADLAATGVVALAGMVRAARSGLDVLVAELRRRPRDAGRSPFARVDAVFATMAELELAGQWAFRQARLARAAATVAGAPSAALARDQRELQGRAIGHAFAVRPAGTAPSDATDAWRDAWRDDDPRAGAAGFAAAHAAHVVRLALGTSGVDAEAVHATVARTVLRMAGAGRTPEQRERLAARLDAGPLAAHAGALRASPPAATPPSTRAGLEPAADAQHDAGEVASDAAASPSAPRPIVTGARFDAARGTIVLTLSTGAQLSLPSSFVPRLGAASDAERVLVRVSAHGSRLEWTAMGHEVAVRDLLQAALGLSI